MQNDLIEKMARATYEKWIENVQCCEPSWDEVCDSHKLRLISATKAGFSAFQDHLTERSLKIVAREPTKEMRKAGYGYLDAALTFRCPVDARDCTPTFRAMFDAAPDLLAGGDDD